MKQIMAYAALAALSAGAHSASEEELWLSVDSNALTHYQQTIKKGEPLHRVGKTALPGELHLVKMSADEVPELSRFMHQEYHRCGGFIAHDSYLEAQAYIAKVANLAPQTLASYSIDNATTANALLGQIDTQGLENTVSGLSAFYNRYYTQQSGLDASDWVKNEWQQIAAGRGDITVETVNHSWSQHSVVATITGQDLSDEVVIIGAHLDSINQSNPSGGQAPGADDNASGIAVLTEALKAIVAAGYQPSRTIKIMGFAAEEVGLRGSQSIAADYKAAGVNVIGMAQFDMTGYKGTLNKDIVFMTDYTNAGQNQFMADLIDTYLSGVTYGYDQCGYGCSDHASWYNEGYPTSMPFESAFNDYNSDIHSSNDNHFDSSHAVKFARLAGVFLAELAKTAGNPPVNDTVLENGVAKTNLAGAAKAQLFYTLDVPVGASNLTFNTTGGTGDADLYVKFGAKPSLTSFDCKSTSSSSTESCAITPVQSGTYHVMVEAWNQISGVSLTGSYSEGGGTGPATVDRTESNISVAQGAWQHYTQTLDAGYGNLTVTMSGGSGDADLYVTHGTQSTTSSYDCRPYKNGNEETCTFTSPASGTWYIDIRGYSAAANVGLTIQAN